MADQQPTSVTAAPAAQPAKPEPVSAPAAEAPPAEKPKRGRARHDEIRAKLAAVPADPAQAAPAETPKPAADPTPEPKKPAVGAVMRLTSENSKLKSDLEALQAKLAAASKGETLDSLREKVKKDPAILFDVFGADLDADEQKRLAKFNDAVLNRADPAYKAQSEVDERIAKLERELEEARKGEQTRASQDRDAKARAHTAMVLTEGFKAEDGTAVIDPAKYPYVNHLTKTGEVDAHAGVMYATRELASAFREKNGRDPTDREIATMIGIAASEAEAYFSKRAKNWQLPSAEPAPAPVADEPAARPTPRTIGSGLGSRAPGAVDTKHLSKSEKHALIRERLRRAQAQAVSN